MGWVCGTNGEVRRAYMALDGKPDRRDHLEDLGVDGRIILKQISRKKGSSHRQNKSKIKTIVSLTSSVNPFQVTCATKFRCNPVAQ
jgi:hypothetical protein